MSNEEALKTASIPVLHVHSEECDEGSCGCGCGDIPLVALKTPEKAATSQECCEPVCGPETCG